VDRCEAGPRIKFRSCSLPLPLASSPRRGNTRLFDLNVAEDDDRIQRCRSTLQSWPSSRRSRPRVESVRMGDWVILMDTDAITYYHFYHSLYELHADTPSLFSTFPAVTTALFAIANSIYHDEFVLQNISRDVPVLGAFVQHDRASIVTVYYPPSGPCCTGGKGTVRRKVVKSTKASGGQDDRKLQAALKKLNMQPISGVEELNMFREDGSVLHFSAPKGVCYCSFLHTLRPRGP